MTGLPEPGGASVHRDNGLPASRWVLLADVDPAVGERLLVTLAALEVPALLEIPPAAGQPGGSGSSPSVLYVDADRQDDARSALARDFADSTRLRVPPRTPAAEVDTDAAWAEIVSGWDRSETGPVPPWPVSEELDQAGHGSDLTQRAPGAQTPGAQPPASGAAMPGPALGPRDHVPAEDPRDDHYVPPPPPPLPRLRRNTILALAALVLGIVLLFAPGLVGLYRADWVVVAGIVCVVGSVAALVYGMRDSGVDPDDGAVV